MILVGTDISVVNGIPSKKIFIIAPTYKRYEMWCRDHEINPRSPMIKYVRSPEDFHGHAHAWYRDLGTSFEKAGEIYDMLELCERTRGFRQIPH